MTGEGADAGPASTVTDEIVAEGGAAAADTHDVATVAGAEALVATAIERFGRLDVVVTNAGIMRWAAFPDVGDADLAAHLDVHVGGSFHTVRAAWPHLVAQGYGRIVTTTSAGVLGLANNTAYATAKGGVIGLSRSLAVAGRRHGVVVNCLAPAAWTRMAGPAPEGDTGMDPDLVAPMAAFLAHESCPVSGEVYAAGAGRFARVFIGSTPGHLHADEPPTIDDVAAHWAEINAEAGYTVPADLMEWTATFTGHLPR